MAQTKQNLIIYLKYTNKYFTWLQIKRIVIKTQISKRKYVISDISEKG